MSVIDELHKDHDCKPGPCECACGCDSYLGCTVFFGPYCGGCLQNMVRHPSDTDCGIKDPFDYMLCDEAEPCDS